MSALASGSASTFAWNSSASWLALILIMMAAAIILCLALPRRWRLRWGLGACLWLEALGLCLIPLAMLPLADVAILHNSTSDAFCATCHRAMQPYFSDMRNPAGRALAAVHFRDGAMPGRNCYGCHADFGITGMVAAKLAGVRDAWVNLGGAYRLPNPAGDRFSNRLCLKCHAQSARFLAIDAHLEDNRHIAADLLSDVSSCEECHGPGHQIDGRRAKS
ncbi:MAG TPA: hypothetical protein VKV28_07955 [Candidatus Binataceae bacterium]|nr:hypothetical protein [Candidatus Binataceae bacterium]